MFYFIPSWYNHDRKWYDNIQIWFRQAQTMEFDDTINQIRIFKNAQENAKLLVLNYAPNLRYFLHRQGIYEIDALSLFDILQDTQNAKYRVTNYKDFNWDRDVNFVYTPFVIVARKGIEKIAEIEMGADGNVIGLVYFEQQTITKKYVFDDRGFLSSIIYFENGQANYQDYLNYNGIWRFRENLENQTIEINPIFKKDFSQSSYDNIESLIKESFLKQMSGLSTRDTLVVSASNQNIEMVFTDTNTSCKKIISFFEDKYDFNENSNNRLINCADLIIADTKKTYHKLLELSEKLAFSSDKILNITPYDTRLKLAKSDTIKELIIYFLVDNISRDKFKTVAYRMFDMMLNHKHINIKFASYGRNGFTKEYLEDFIKEVLAEEKYKVFLYKDNEINAEIKEVCKVTDEAFTKIQYCMIHTEDDVIRELEYVRLIIDVGDEADVYTQIAGISSGIPQINSNETSYVEHMKNGIILTQDDKLEEAINYYFIGLKNWNQSLVYSVDKLLEYTGTRLIKKWKDKLGC